MAPKIHKKNSEHTNYHLNLILTLYQCLSRYFHAFSYYKNQKKYALMRKIVTAKAAAIANKTKGFIAIFDIRDLLFFCLADL